jgi:hypothetical protein
LSEPESVVLLKPEAFRSAVIERCTTALEQYGVVG